MARPLRSDAAFNAGRRAQWRALGLTDEDFKKPKIAVVNSSSELAVCFAHLDGVAKVVKQAIREAGGVPFEVRTTAPSDFIVSAANGGGYILPSRDLVTNDIEAQVGAAMLDGMVCLSSCDKTPPGHLMAAGRLNIPSIIVVGGYQKSGELNGEHVDVEDVFLEQVHVRIGRPGNRDLNAMADNAIRGPGVCAGMATANSMAVVCEALGMTMPGNAPVAANSETMFDYARKAGQRIVGMIEEDLTPRKIMTRESFLNAAAAVLAVAGSINCVKHLQAIAVETGTDVDVFGLFRELTGKIPVLSAIRPNGAHYIQDFDRAGGARAVLKQLQGLIEPSALTVTGKTLAENLADYRVADEEVIRPVDRAYTFKAPIVILKGSLAPESAIAKMGLRTDNSRPDTFEGTAIVYETGPGALDGLAKGEVKPGHVLIARNQGVVGGPGMAGGAASIVFAIDGAGLSQDVAFITDGQLSGLCNKGLTIAEVSPEAATGGPISLVRDGDRITVDVDAGTIELNVPAEELARRQAEAPRPLNPASGWLAQYRDEVRPMSRGATLAPAGRS
jgi:dihydroxy-acid dehydratase